MLAQLSGGAADPAQVLHPSPVVQTTEDYGAIVQASFSNGNLSPRE